MSNLASESRGPQVIIACSILCAIATVGLGLRLYSRIGVTKNVGIDDATLSLAWMIQIASTGFIIQETKYGLGRHFTTVSQLELQKLSKILIPAILTYNISLILTKISILLQYQRFLLTPLMKNLCRIVLAFVILYIITTVTIVTLIFHYDCQVSDKRPHCFNTEAFWIVHASLNIFTDFIILLLPVPFLLNVSLPMRQRYGLIAIFTIGIIVCFISIIRLTDVISADKSKDITWVEASVSIWSQSEICIAILCASLPGMKPLIKHWTGHSGDTTVKTGGTDETTERGLVTNDMRENEMKAT